MSEIECIFTCQISAFLTGWNHRHWISPNSSASKLLLALVSDMFVAVHAQFYDGWNFSQCKLQTSSWSAVQKQLKLSQDKPVQRCSNTREILHFCAFLWKYSIFGASFLAPNNFFFSTYCHLLDRQFCRTQTQVQLSFSSQNHHANVDPELFGNALPFAFPRQYHHWKICVVHLGFFCRIWKCDIFGKNESLQTRFHSVCTSLSHFQFSQSDPTPKLCYFCHSF